MASTTPKLGLRKIDLTDAPPDITVLNDNWDKLDELAVRIEPFVITFESTGSGYAADKTFTEALTAFNAGRKVVGYYNQCEYPMVTTDSINHFVFSSSESNTSITIILGSDNSVQINRVLFAPLYSYGQGDLTVGVSELATGTLHFVYE